MGRIVRLAIDNQTLVASTNTDILLYTGPSTQKSKLMYAWCSFDFPAIQDPAFRMFIVRRTSAGSGGAAIGELMNDEDDDTSNIGEGIQLRTTPGTQGNLIHTFFNEGIGEFRFEPPEKARPVLQASGRVAIFLANNLGSSNTVSAGMCLELI